MAGQRYLRYIVFAVICITLIFFISSSSTSTQSRAPTTTFGDDYKKPRPRPTHSPAPSLDDEDDFLSSKHGSSTVDDADDTEQTLVANPHKPGVVTAPHELDYSEEDQDQGYEHHAPSKAPGTSANPKPVLGETAPGERMNATFVTLARNSDVWEIAKSIRQVEDRFNRKFHYDWVFLNDQEFDDTFKEVTTSLVSGRTRYGLIPEKHWSFPDFIDQDKAAQVREDMKKAEIIYGDSISYRHMCRFESGFFFWQDLMLEYEWYWRVEPSIELYCDIDYDTFKFMAEKKKKYSFTISLYEYIETIPTIWKSAKKFMEKYPEHIAEDNSMDFLSDDGGDTYNKCHFWSNFEIGNLDWLRSQAYTDYFNVLDQDGGFFYERWGDAPVHSIAAGLLLKKDEIHFFNDIAYYHVPFTHCPTGEQYKIDHKCTCSKGQNFDWNGYSCTARFYELHGWEKPEGAPLTPREKRRRAYYFIGGWFILIAVVELRFRLVRKYLLRR